jgi:hypothetical protein
MSSAELHELCKRRTTEDCMVGPVEVGDHKVDELCAEVVWCSELDGERYLAKGY